jgi:SAM-dependent methyltransferase
VPIGSGDDRPGGGVRQEHLEEARCFRCGREGKRLYRLDGFGVVRCPECRQVFVSPRLAEGAQAAIYHDRSYFDEGIYAGGSRMAASLQRSWTRGRLELIESALPSAPAGRRLLEIGCAYGHFLAAARDRGFEVKGLEFSTAAAEQARARGLHVEQGRLEALPEEEGFDVVVFWDVIEHVPDPPAFLQAVRQVARPGGVIAFSCPYFDSVPAKVFRSRWWMLKPDEHIWHFTTRTLRRLFDEAGMPVEQLIRSPLARPNVGRFDSVVGVARR